MYSSPLIKALQLSKTTLPKGGPQLGDAERTAASASETVVATLERT